MATRGYNHICLLFVKKEYHRLGIARKLFKQALEICKTQQNIHEMTVNSAPFSIEVYHRLGFMDTGQEQTVNGMRFTPMRYE